MNPLIDNKIPAYGFETKKINAAFNTNQVAAETATRHGLRKNSTIRNVVIVGTAKNDITMRNIEKFAGYIPLLGAFIGIKRIHAVRIDHAVHYSKLHYIRAALEILGLGLLSAPVDLIFTLRWKHQAHKNVN